MSGPFQGADRVRHQGDAEPRRDEVHERGRFDHLLHDPRHEAAARQASRKSWRSANRAGACETKDSSDNSPRAIAARSASGAPPARATPTPRPGPPPHRSEGSLRRPGRKQRSVRWAWSAAGCCAGGISCRRTSTAGSARRRAESAARGAGQDRAGEADIEGAAASGPDARASAQASSNLRQDAPRPGEEGGLRRGSAPRCGWCAREAGVPIRLEGRGSAAQGPAGARLPGAPPPREAQGFRHRHEVAQVP